MVQWYDTATLFRVQLAELIALETLRTYHVGDTSVTIRRLQASQKLRDSLETTSTQHHSEVSAQKDELTQERPLMEQSIKRGLEWRRTLVFSGCVIFFALFVYWIRFVKRN